MATIKARKDGTMELKELLGDDLYKQVQAKIDEKNSTETDKLKHVRYTDLSEGKYVSKEKYDSELEKLNGLITGKDTEIGNANKLIEELKKASKGDEGMQQKISTYETENARLQKELEETKVNSAIKVALLEAHAVDTDYMTYSGLGNPVGQAETQLSKSIVGKLDNDLLDAAYTSENVYTPDTLAVPVRQRSRFSSL